MLTTRSSAILAVNGRTATIFDSTKILRTSVTNFVVLKSRIRESKSAVKKISSVAGFVYNWFSTVKMYKYLHKHALF